jgi:hypothetical protein
MIEIPIEIYHRMAECLRTRIAAAEWFNGTVEIEAETFDVRLILTAIVYRRTESLPEGVIRPISDVVPVWWECVCTCEGGVVPNDFSFNELKPYLIDND